jgi:hypothetical protein
MNLTVGQYKFNPKTVARETEGAYSAGSFTSWVMVARVLAKRGFNRYEAEAILRSKITRWCRGNKHPAPSTDLSKYLDENNVTPGCKEVVSLVMGTFDGSVEGCPDLKLELNDKGVPCTRGTMPGNYDPKKTILVPLGTPLCCDPTSETYWSM